MFSLVLICQSYPMQFRRFLHWTLLPILIFPAPPRQYATMFSALIILPNVLEPHFAPNKLTVCTTHQS